MALTAAELHLAAPGPGLVPGRERPTPLGELLPAAARSDAALARELQRVVEMEAKLAAYRAQLVVELASRRPAVHDRQPGQPGAASEPDEPGRSGVSEFVPDELALVLNCSRAAASALLETSRTLLQRLPATWAALADGRLDFPRARALAAELGWPARDTDPALVAEVEAAVLPLAPTVSVTRLKAATRAALLERDAAAADRRRRAAARAADVVLRPLGDGMAELAALMPAPVAAACRNALDSYARLAREDGEKRSIGQLRVGVLGDLILRPWDERRPPVSAHVTVVAPLAALRGAAPRSARAAVPATSRLLPLAGRMAEVDGLPITVQHVRELLAELDAVCPCGSRSSAGGSLSVAVVDPDSGALRATTDRRELARTARRGCAAHPGQSCGCAVLDKPPALARYRPSPAQRRWVRTRDRTCRHPGCAIRAGWSDLDHVVAHAEGGATDCANMCCLCRRHHRLKTHARGWRFALAADGSLAVTTPSGVTRTTRPPGLVDALISGPPAPVGTHDPPPF